MRLWISSTSVSTYDTEQMAATLSALRAGRDAVESRGYKWRKLMTPSVATFVAGRKNRRSFSTSSFAPVAQLDRASVFGTEGWGFESLRVYLT